MSRAKKWTLSMNKYLLSDKYADLAILMTGGMKPEYYNRERIFIYLLIYDQVINGKTTNHTVPPPLLLPS